MAAAQREFLAINRTAILDSMPGAACLLWWMWMSWFHQASRIESHILTVKQLNLIFDLIERLKIKIK